MIKCFTNEMMVAFTEFSAGRQRRGLENGHQEISGIWKE